MSKIQHHVVDLVSIILDLKYHSRSEHTINLYIHQSNFVLGYTNCTKDISYVLNAVPCHVKYIHASYLYTDMLCYVYVAEDEQTKMKLVTCSTGLNRQTHSEMIFFLFLYK